MIGQTLNEYCVEAELAVTSTGTVYRTLHTLLQIPRTIKIIHPQLASKDTVRKRVQLALEAWAKLDHPNFVHIFEAIENKSIFGFAMDYVSGITLREILQNQGKLGISQAIDYFLQIAKALSYAHTHQILHRKLAPENIKICTDESVKILGLGALRCFHTPKITPENICVGKVKYMAPEQFQGSYSIHSDQYSLGVILYEMVTGQPPFQGKNLAELYKMHVLEPPIPPKKINPDITNELQKIILRLLAKKPQERFPALVNVIDALNEATDRIDFSNDVSLPSLMSKGRSSLEKRNLDHAIYYFNRILSLYGYGTSESQEAFVKRNQAILSQKEEEDMRKVRDLAMQALGYFDDEKFEQSCKLLRIIFEIMRKHPDSIRIRGVRMDLLHEMPDLVKEVEEELEHQWNKAKFSLENAERLLEESQYSSALGMLEDALRYDPGNEKVQKLIIEVRNKQNILEATQYYCSALLHFHRKNYCDATNLLEKVLELYPNHTSAKKYLQQSRDFIEKEKKRQTQIEKLYNEGCEYYEKSLYGDALQNFEKLLELDPNHYQTQILVEELKERVEDENKIEQISFFYNKGQEFYTSRKWKEAIACFHRVLEIMPSHRNAVQYEKIAGENIQKEESFQQVFNSGVSLFESNQYRLALEKFESLSKDEPDNVEVRKYRHLCLELMAEYGE